MFHEISVLTAKMPNKSCCTSTEIYPGNGCYIASLAVNWLRWRSCGLSTQLAIY